MSPTARNTGLLTVRLFAIAVADEDSVQSELPAPTAGLPTPNAIVCVWPPLLESSGFPVESVTKIRLIVAPTISAFAPLVIPPDVAGSPISVFCADIAPDELVLEMSDATPPTVFPATIVFTDVQAEVLIPPPVRPAVFHVIVSFVVVSDPVACDVEF